MGKDMCHLKALELSLVREQIPIIVLGIIAIFPHASCRFVLVETTTYDTTMPVADEALTAEL